MRSEISARARRRAFAFGSFARNGLIGRAPLTAPPRAGLGGGTGGREGAAVVTFMGDGAGRGGAGSGDIIGGAGRGGCAIGGACGSGAGRGACAIGGAAADVGSGLAGGRGGSPPGGNAPEGRPPPWAEIPGEATGVGIEDGRGAGDAGGIDDVGGTTGVARVTGWAIGGVAALPKWDDEPCAAGGAAGAAPGAVDITSRDTVMTPPHTAHLARTLAPGIRPGSTRNIDRHSGHETFMSRVPPRWTGRSPRARRADRPRPECCPCDDRSKTPIPAASWRSSSFL